MELKELLNSFPVWIGLSVWIIYAVVTITMKYFERNLTMKIEADKRNIEVKKYNEEAVWKEKVMSLLNKEVIDVLSFAQAQYIYTFSIQSAERDLLLKLYDIIDRNHIENKHRQLIIHQDLLSYLENQKNRIYRAVDGLHCNGIRLSHYVLSTSEIHTNDFVILIEKFLFDENIEVMQKKQDLKTIISAHYNNHANEAIDWLKEPVVK